MKKLILGLILGILLTGFMGFIIAEEVTCEDSDGSKGYFNKGDVFVVGNVSGVLTVTDFCLSTLDNYQTILDKMVVDGIISQDQVGNDNILIEGSCPWDINDLNNPLYNPFDYQVAYECPNGCEDGVCIKDDEVIGGDNETGSDEVIGGDNDEAGDWIQGRPVESKVKSSGVLIIISIFVIIIVVLIKIIITKLVKMKRKNRRSVQKHQTKVLN